MVLIDRPYTISYWSAIVSSALSCTIFELFHGKEYDDLEVCARDQSRSLEIAPFSRSPQALL